MRRLRFLGFNRDTLQDRQRVFRNMPRQSRILFYLVVFCTLAPIGVLPNILTLGAVPVPYVFFYAACWGGLGLLLAFASLRTIRVFALAIGVVVIAAVALKQFALKFHEPTSLDAAAIANAQTNLRAIMWVTMGAIAVAYRAAFTLVTREGRRYWGAHAEIQLAHEIHSALVPAVTGEHPSLAWRGVSYPSGQVGGDLVDVVDRQDVDGVWIGCVADVSGHGVGAGLLMGMFKTALHSVVHDVPNAGMLMTRINGVLGPLSTPNMFVTAATLRRVNAETFEYVLAGHPPFLCWRARDRRTEWVGESQLAMCVLPDVRYESQTFAVASGDLIIAVTDGLLEVFDEADRELGRAGLTRALDGIDATMSLDEIEQRIFEVCRRHGRRADDQTVLIVRVGSENPACTSVEAAD